MERSSLDVVQEYALQCYENRENIFLTGPGGTGKSSLIRFMVDISNKRKDKVQVCAMTGCAAILLHCNATTLHSWSGMKMAKGKNCEIITNIKNNRKACSHWRKANILILDEVSMLSLRTFELLNEIAIVVRNNKKPFGGLQLVFSGDFYQLPPIGDTEEGSGQFCFESKLWNVVFPMDNHIELTKLFRQKDPVYKRILNNIRCGVIEKEDMVLLKNRLHVEYNKEENNGVVPTKLYSTKASVDKINQQEFDKLTTPSYEYHIIQKEDCVLNLETGKPLPCIKNDKDMTKIQKEMEFRYLTDNSPIEKVLYLKEGANVMCTVNLDIDSGICNGALGIITSFIQSVQGPPHPVVLFSNGVKREFHIKYWQSEEHPVLAVGQIPLKLAWAMTIHKSQGATLSMGEIDIGNTIFECGQTYVALSRIQSLEGLYLRAFNPTKIRVNIKVQEFYRNIPKFTYDEEEQKVDETIEREGNEDQSKTIFHSAAASAVEELTFEKYIYTVSKV
jgi:ATP-dependent DNA helicase PIF1